MSSDIAKVNSGFEVQKTTEKAGGEIGAAREMQAVQAMVLMAKKFPRNEGQCVDKIINACTRPGLAETALYQYARGGANVSGPTIRLAENIAKCWGNVEYGVCELSSENGESSMQAFAWDLETNVRVTKTFKVQHGRYSKSKGVTDLVDPRDIYENNANNSARRVRACILGLIPQDVNETAVKQVGVTLNASEDCSADAIKGMVKAFEEAGVTKDMIEEFIQRKISVMTPALKIRLRNIYASLRDGMSKVEDWFTVSGASISEFEKPENSKPEKPKTEKPKVEKPKPDTSGVDGDDFDKATSE